MIVLGGVTKRFNHVFAVNDVSFEVTAGEAVALVGPSGSGKTTILRLIAGLETPDRGSIHLNGRLASESGWACPPHQRGVGMVFQRLALWPHMTVLQNVRFGLAGLPPAVAEQRLRQTLRLTHLEGLEKRHPHRLSGGEAQRVALARALAPKPSILLLDEPLASLDVELKGHLLELIQTVRRETGTTIVYVTHDWSEAATVTDGVVVLRQGRVVRMGRWDQISEAEP